MPDGTNRPSSDSSTIRRRRFLVGSAGAGSLLLAGCSGGGDGGDGGGEDGGSDGGDGGGDGGNGDSDAGDGDSNGGSGGPSGRVTMLTAPPGTQGNAMGNAMMSLLTQETDLEGSAQAGSGSTQNVIQVMRGEAELSRGVTSLLYSAYQREEPVDVETEYDPLQLTSHQYLRLFAVAKAGSDYEYVSDLSGQPFGVGPQAASFQFALSSHFETAMDDYTPSFQAPNDMAPQLAADNLDATIVMNANGAVPSFAQQIIARNDVRLLGWREETMAEIRDDPDLNSFMQPNSFWEEQGVSEFTMDGETFVPAVNYSMISSGATSQEVVYTFLNTMFQNRDQLPELNAGFAPWTEASFWNQLCDPRIPFHPGAAQLLRENDLWQDDFQEAEI